MNTPREQALFLAGGPGLSSALERRWFGDTLPIHWWEQPKIGGEASPIAALVASAAAQLQEMAREAPIHLVASSFGGQVAHALARDYPQLIERVTLLGCTIDPHASIRRLCRFLAARGESQTAAEAVANAEAELTPQTYAAMVEAITTAPSFPAFYFAPHSMAAFERFVAIVSGIDFFDVESNLAGMNALIGAPSLEPLPGYSGAVTLVAGKYDPVFSLEEDVAKWRRIYPQLALRIVEAGHLIHLETPPDEWFYREQS